MEAMNFNEPTFEDFFSLLENGGDRVPKGLYGTILNEVVADSDVTHFAWSLSSDERLAGKDFDNVVSGLKAQLKKEKYANSGLSIRDIPAHEETGRERLTAIYHRARHIAVIEAANARKAAEEARSEQ